MRPIELVLECFGAYRERTSVDFGQLGSLFLVWGKTGSGKSTLFDAMSYALYGEAPGGRRGLSRELRSQYATPEQKPLVQFTFALGSHCWRARRSPPWSKINKRGNSVEVPQEAFLESLVGDEWKPEAEGPRDVDARVRELLGLSPEEFSKVILLPQGEFQRFLDMSSTERVGILEKLFPVALHDRVTSIAVERAKAAVLESRRLDEAIARIREAGGGTEGEAKLPEILTEEALVGVEEAGALRARIEAENLLSQGREEMARRADHERALARLETAQVAMAEEGALSLRIDTARRATAALPRLDEAGRAAREAEAARKILASRSAELALHEAKRGATEADRTAARELDAELARLNLGIGELGPALAAWNELARARAKAAELRKGMEKRALKIGEARVAMEVARDAFEAGKIGLEELERARLDFEAARAALERASTVSRLAAAAARSEVAVEAAARAKTLAAEGLERCERALAERQKNRNRSLAAELASGLEAGSPCPVCGSLEHPAPAAGESEAIEADVESARGARDAALARDASAGEQFRQRTEAREAAQMELASIGLIWKETIDEGRAAAGLAACEAEASAKAAAHREALTKKTREELLAADREARAAELRNLEAAEGSDREALAAAESAIDTLASRAGEEDPKKRLESLEQLRQAVKDRLRDTRSRIEAWEQALGSLSARHAESATRQPGLDATAMDAQALAREALDAAGFASEDEARAAAIDGGALAALEARLQRIQIEFAAASAAAEAAARSVGPGPKPDLEARAAAVEEANRRHGESAARLEALRSSRQSLEALLNQRRSLETERAALGDAANRLDFLSRLLAGGLAPRRLPFKNWVLAAWFRTVVDRASLRLSELSDGRYTLVAIEGQGQGRLGLELLVQDAWTGRSRPAGTLSGGERFLSSLALALGLADGIRSRSAGVSLEAVFIDEGFGSLDDETLDRAISALDRARGGRMIGIVSHVAELRNRIPSRIEVRKGRRGSNIEIVN